MSKRHLTAEELRSLIHYSPETGVFTRKVERGPFKIGSIAGTTLNTGYRAIIILGSPYQAHRLAWLYMTGECPKHELDHINHDKADNRFSNLRDVMKFENQQNRKSARVDNKAGLLGVSPLGNRFVAQIQVNKQKLHLGVYETPEQAHQAYLSAKISLHSTYNV